MRACGHCGRSIEHRRWNALYCNDTHSKAAYYKRRGRRIRQHRQGLKRAQKKLAAPPRICKRPGCGSRVLRRPHAHYCSVECQERWDRDHLQGLRKKPTPERHCPGCGVELPPHRHGCAACLLKGRRERYQARYHDPIWRARKLHNDRVRKMRKPEIREKEKMRARKQRNEAAAYRRIMAMMETT